MRRSFPRSALFTPGRSALGDRRLNQTPVIFSEDFSAGGAVLNGIRFVDPFADDFDVEAWAPLA